jgi:Fur family iron response transcriptional regulator
MMNYTQRTQIDPNVDFAQQLRHAGITPTQQRVEMAEIIFTRAQHLSADQILKQVNERDKYVSKATVYNTLGLFTEKGLLREVIVDPTKVFYDSNISEHHHFYNIDTGALTDVDSGDMLLGDLPKLPTGTVATGVEIIIKIKSDTPL